MGAVESADLAAVSTPADGGPAWLAAGRVPSLDGLRGVSILLVLWSHLSLYANDGTWPRWVTRFTNVGDIGVDVFFVISGFLITLLLIRERERTGRIRLGGFYLRRTCRIMPAYVTYVVVVGAVLSFTPDRLTGGAWATAATYTVSVVGNRSWYTGHLWSLSVEEHFYLVWPLLFGLLPNRRLLWACLAYSAAAVVARVILVPRVSLPTDPNLFSPIRADAIAAGCALALVAMSPHRRLLRWGPGAATAVAAAAVGGLVASHVAASGRFPAYRDYGCRFVNEWLIVALVWAAASRPAAPVGWVLDRRPLTALGVLSYSVYLWQQPFFGAHRSHWFCRPPGNFLAAAVLACASYFAVERPFLRLKSRLEPTRDGRRRAEAEASWPAANGGPTISGLGPIPSPARD